MTDVFNKRNALDISFHALRHTATSLMKNASISPALVQEFSRPRRWRPRSAPTRRRGAGARPTARSPTP